MNIVLEAVERGWLPDSVVRAGIRSLLRDRRNAQQKQAGRKSGGAFEQHLACLLYTSDAADE